MLHQHFKTESQTLEEKTKHSEYLRTELKQQEKTETFCLLLENTVYKN